MPYAIFSVRFCPVCKKHYQATKKLDLWRLPEILVIHLKRFSYSRFLKNKLETFVDFPVHDLDLSAYIAHKEGQTSHRYMLYALSNHYGSMGGGHYTAYVHVRTPLSCWPFFLCVSFILCHTFFMSFIFLGIKLLYINFLSGWY